MKRFKLSDEQAEAILNLRLRNLAKLEEMKIRGEQDELQAELDDILKTLKSKVRMNKLVRGELLEAAEKFGDERRTLIIETRVRAGAGRDCAGAERAGYRDPLGARLCACGKGSRDRSTLPGLQVR